MKIRKFTFSLLFTATALLLVGCSSSQYVMDSDYDVHGKFKEYRSFAFMSNSYSGNGDYEEQIVKNTLFKRLVSMGYRYDEVNPDLLVSCKFFYQETRMVGFEQSNLSHWLKYEGGGQEQQNPKHKNYYKQKVNLPADSYTIFLVDAKTNRMIWKGYSGQPEPWSHEQQLVASITRVMDDYEVVAY